MKPAPRKTPCRLGLVVAALALAATSSGAPAGAQEGEPRLTVRAQPAAAEIGDRVFIHLELEVPGGLAVGPPIFPVWDGSWGELEVVDAAPTAVQSDPQGATRYRHTVTVVPWRTGEIEIPPARVELPTADEILTLESESAALTVRSVLPVGDQQPTPKPPAPPRPLPIDDSFWWTMGAAGALCLLAALLLFVRRRRAAAADAAPPVEPLVALRRDLARLEETGEADVVITGLSFALRRYLGSRLDFPAVESTTTEIRRRLQQQGLSPSLAAPLDRLLRRCDAIKFARRPIERAACTAALAEALQLGEGIEELLRPADDEDETTGDREAA